MDIPKTATIIQKTQETSDIFSLALQFTCQTDQQNYHYFPGQFNMLYLFGVGEVPISIVSEPNQNQCYHHTIRRVGRVTNGLSLLQTGDQLGVRGPFGRGWPLARARGKDVLIITGGLGCAPSVSIIHHILARREEFGQLTILQGVKHSDDFIFRKQYQAWENSRDTTVLLAADVSKPGWSWHTGPVIELINKIKIDINQTICMMCGPQAMLIAAITYLRQLHLPEQAIYLNIERNMECATGHCGHCQFGEKFVCKDGPVFCYSEIKHLLGKKGF